MQNQKSFLLSTVYLSTEFSLSLSTNYFSKFSFDFKQFFALI